MTAFDMQIAALALLSARRGLAATRITPVHSGETAQASNVGGKGFAERVLWNVGSGPR